MDVIAKSGGSTVVCSVWCDVDTGTRPKTVIKTVKIAGTFSLPGMAVFVGQGAIPGTLPPSRVTETSKKRKPTFSETS